MLQRFHSADGYSDAVLEGMVTRIRRDSAGNES
jgi:hypothetical protein